MKWSCRSYAQIALIVSAATSSAVAIDSVTTIFGAPGFNPVTRTGFKPHFYQAQVFVNGTTLANDGALVSRIAHYENNVLQYRTNALWRSTDPVVFFDSVGPTEEPDVILRINSSHQTIGLIPEEYINAATWSSDGNLTVLPPLEPAGFVGTVQDINDAGTMVGEGIKNSDGVAVKWPTTTSVTQLPTLESWGEILNARAFAINESGDILGDVNSTSGERSVIWHEDGSVTALAQITDTGIDIGGWSPILLNGHGQVVGSGSYHDGTGLRKTAAIWRSASEAIELEHLPADEIVRIDIYNLNNSGEAIGRERIRTDAIDSIRAVKWYSDGSIQELGRLPNADFASSTTAMQINDLGYAVGCADEEFSETIGGKAVLWTPGGELIVLDDLLPAGSGWRTLFFASGITNTGWIKGYGYYDENGPASPAGANREWSMLVPEVGTYGLGDANFDLSIDFADLLIVAQNYGEQTEGSVDMGDLDLDGVVGFSDLLTVAQNYGGSLGLLPSDASAGFIADWNLARSMVPEPTALLGVAGINVFLRRRR